MEKPVAIITGSARRLGRRIAVALAKKNFRVVINYSKSKVQSDHTVREIKSFGGEVFSVKADISKESEARKLIHSTMKRFGQIDLLINNAAVFPKRYEFGKIPVSVWDNVLGINLKGSFLCSKFASVEMQKRKNGQIINIASLGAFLNWSGYIPYCVSKSGVVTLTRLMAKALAPHIRVNAVAPGTIIIPSEEKNNVHKPDVEKILLKKYGKPSDIVDMVLFLAIQSEYITGQVFTVDGGATIL